MSRRNAIKSLATLPFAYITTKDLNVNSMMAMEQNILIKENSGIYIKPNTGIDISYYFQQAVDDSSGKTIFLEKGDYIIANPINIKNDTSISGLGMQTKITSNVPDDKGTFVTKRNQWPFRAKISNIHLVGNEKKNYGILSGDPTIPDDNNAPFMMLENVVVSNFKAGIYLEGYGHHLTLCFATHCNEGFKIFHPEQVLLLNCWAEYCYYGLTVNNPDTHKILKSGHNFKIIGGAYQRNQVGIRLWKTFDPSIDTYAELNTLNDIILGEDHITNYEQSVHTAFIKLVTSSNPFDCCIRMNATVAASIDFIRASQQKNDRTYIISDGWSKNIIVRYPPSKITSQEPFLFQGNSAKNSIAIPYGKSETIN